VIFASEVLVAAILDRRLYRSLVLNIPTTTDRLTDLEELPMGSRA
jgi:hypothetical protein